MTVVAKAELAQSYSAQETTCRFNKGAFTPLTLSWGLRPIAARV